MELIEQKYTLVLQGVFEKWRVIDHIQREYELCGHMRVTELPTDHMRANFTLRFGRRESELTIVECDKIGQIFDDDSYRIILIVDSLREDVGTYGIKPDSLRNNFVCEVGSCVEYGHSHHIIL